MTIKDFFCKFGPVIILFVLIAFSIFSKKDEQLSKLKALAKANRYSIISVIKKEDASLYTQGLIIDKNNLYESGGLYKHSTINRYNYPSFTDRRKIDLPKDVFAEGIAICRRANRIFQLTYKENITMLYSYPEMNYLGHVHSIKDMREGWGLCEGRTDNEMFATDGSEYIFVLECNETGYSLKNKIKVTYKNRPIDLLNDLVFGKGFIYANRYFDRVILKIDVETGVVVDVYDMESLILYEIEKFDLTIDRIKSGDVLNGIAYDKEADLFLLTGKKWSNYYQIRFP